MSDAAISELAEVEANMNALLLREDPQQKATFNRLYDRRRKLWRVIHADETRRAEASGLIPWGCDDPACSYCQEYGIGPCHREGNLKKGVRWNAARQCWERRGWRPATAEERARWESDEGDAHAPAEAYATHRQCWDRETGRYRDGGDEALYCDWHGDELMTRCWE